MTISPYVNYKIPSATRIVVVGAALVVFTVSTGGYSTVQCFVARGTKEYGENKTFSAEPAKAVAVSRDSYTALSPAEDLKFIRDYFKPSVVQLASAFGVERQTIYDWQAGKRVSDERRDTIRELASTCSKLAEAGIVAGDDILRRKISNGQTLLQLVASGMSAFDGVLLTKSILETEQKERRLLAEHLKRRPLGKIDTEEAGIPRISEEG